MKIQFTPLTRIDQIKQGDKLVITDGYKITQCIARLVKVSDDDGVEVIFNIRRNLFFNVGMYLRGESWIDQVYIIEAVK